MLQKRSARGITDASVRRLENSGYWVLMKTKWLKLPVEMFWCAVRKNKARCLLHLQSVFKKNPYYGEDTAKRLFDKGLCLLLGTIQNFV